MLEILYREGWENYRSLLGNAWRQYLYPKIVKDLTRGSIERHIASMALPVAASMLAQAVYQLIDLYFIARLGAAAVAGVNAVGNVLLVVAALTQVLSSGSVALIAQAFGRNSQADANRIFNQSIGLALLCGLAVILLIATTIGRYLQWITVDEATLEAGLTFAMWVLPGYALMLPMAVMTSALRAGGMALPTVALYLITVMINCVLAPVFIAGWGTGVPMGVMGGGLATSVSVLLGVVLGWGYLQRFQRYMTIQWRMLIPKWQESRRVLIIGVPAGGDLVLYSIYVAVVYYVIQDFGVSAQAGFGIGSRVLQTILLPAIAIAVSIGPIAGQNFGAMNHHRVRETFHKAMIAGCVVMATMAVVVQWRSKMLVGRFDAPTAAIEIAAVFLRVTCWSLVAQSIVSTCTNMFIALGNALPSMISTCTRLTVFFFSALWLSRQPGFQIQQVWYVSVASLVLQAMLSLWLLRRECRKRLLPMGETGKSTKSASVAHSDC